MYEHDIELDDLVRSAAGTSSTNQLIPSPDENATSNHILANDADAIIGSLATTKPAITQREKPNYNPAPLKWPYQLFLLFLITGLTIFMEYQDDNLPPARYKILDPLEKRDPLTGPASATMSEVNSHIIMQPSPKIPIITATSTAQATATTGYGQMVDRAVAVPSPTPEARPPKSKYPKPPERVTLHTRCGWDLPKYLIYKSTSPGHSKTQTVLEQTISTFWTYDNSWCPCYVVYYLDPKYHVTMNWNIGWGDRIGPVSSTYHLDSNDQGCHSVLSAVASHNGILGFGFDATVPGHRSGHVVNVDEQQLAHLVPSGDKYDTITLSTFPCQVSPTPWPLPTAKSDGYVLLPFTTSLGPCGASDFECPWQDVFGNNWRAVGYFHATLNTPSSDLLWWTFPLPRRLPLSTELSGCPVIHAQGSSTEDLPSSHTVADIKTENTASRDRPNGTDEIMRNATATPPESSSRGLGASITSSIETRASSSPKLVIGTHVNKTSTTPSSSMDILVGETRETQGSAEHKSVEEIVSLPDTSFGLSHQMLSRPPANISLERTAVLESVTIQASDGPIVTVITTYYDSYTFAPGLAGTEVSSLRPSANPEPAISSMLGSPLTNSTQSLGNNLPPKASTTSTPSSLTGPPPPGPASDVFNLRSDMDFLMASFIPVLLTTLLGIAIQVYTSNLGSMLPFQALARGARTGDSLLLPQSTGPLACIVGIRFIRRYKDALPFLTFLLSTISTVLVPISSEVIRLEHSRHCKNTTDVESPFIPLAIVLASPEAPPRPKEVLCAIGLRKSGIPLRVAEGLLAAMAVLVITIWYMLRQRRTGVATNPWSIASMANLMSDKEFCDKIRSIPRCVDGAYLPKSEIKNALGKNTNFYIGLYKPESNGRSTSEQGYGIVASVPTPQDKTPIRITTKNPPVRKAIPYRRDARWWHLTPNTWNVIIRTVALVFTTGLLALILYYENTISPNTGFEAFMNSETFGVRIMFTSFGTITSWFWDFYFYRKSHTYLSITLTS